MSDPVLAQVALQRLRDSGLDARLTSEAGPADLYTGHQRVVLWVPEEADLAPGLEIVGSLEPEPTESTCRHCGYPLAGHSGPSTCPECGRPIDAETHAVECARCGESVPANFETCWSCGAPTEGRAVAIDAAEPRLDAGPSRRKSAAFIISGVVFLGASSILLASSVPRSAAVPVALVAAVILFWIVRRRASPE